MYAPVSATSPISILNHDTFVSSVVVIPNQANMKIKYITADVTRNVIPRHHIFFLFFMLNSMLIRNISTHIAHGLNPSIVPSIIDKTGNDSSCGFMFFPRMFI